MSVKAKVSKELDIRHLNSQTSGYGLDFVVSNKFAKKFRLQLHFDSHIESSLIEGDGKQVNGKSCDAQWSLILEQTQSLDNKT
jgi:hypothetical protein